MHVDICGKRWRLEFKRMRDTKHDRQLGNCDPPDVPHKSIRINRSLEGEEKLETIIHECLHAANWHYAEESLAQAAEDIARVLWRLGYRDEKA
jgi:hypothetical protein